MKKYTVLFLLIVFLSMTTNTVALAAAAVIPVNTAVVVQSDETYSSSAVKAGDSVNFSVVKNVEIGRKKVIPAGTKVYATVLQSKERARIGRPGEIVIGDFYMTLYGNKVPLSGQISQKAKSKMGLSIALSAIIIPFFLLMRGKNAQITSGSQYELYTASEASL